MGQTFIKQHHEFKGFRATSKLLFIVFKAPNLYLTSYGIEEYVSVVRMIAIPLVIGLGILIYAVSDGIVLVF